MASSRTSVKKWLYLSLVLPILTYASPVWRLNQIKDILPLEQLQRRATKYNVNNPTRIVCLVLIILPLMYQLEIADIMFTISSIKNPSSHFNISHYISFCDSGMRSSSFFKLKHRYTSNNKSRHSFFNRIPRLWNSLPTIDLTISINWTKQSLTSHLTDHFNTHLNPDCSCTFHYLYAHVTHAILHLAVYLINNISYFIPGHPQLASILSVISVR